MKNLFSSDMLKQVRQMQDQLKRAQKELEKESVTGTAGGGIVEIVMSGSQKCLEVRLDAEKMQSVPSDRLQALILQANNDALDLSRKLMVKKLGPLSGSLGGLGGLKS